MFCSSLFKIYSNLFKIDSNTFKINSNLFKIDSNIFTINIFLKIFFTSTLFYGLYVQFHPKMGNVCQTFPNFKKLQISKFKLWDVKNYEEPKWNGFKHKKVIFITWIDSWAEILDF